MKKDNTIKLQILDHHNIILELNCFQLAVNIIRTVSIRRLFYGNIFLLELRYNIVKSWEISGNVVFSQNLQNTQKYPEISKNLR